VKGLSLIEVLVVLLVLASVMIVSTLSLRGLQSRGLSLEAERLGARIHAAHEEARLLAQPIRLELDDRGYPFYRNQLGRWQLIEGDDLLRPRAWDALTSWRADASLVGQVAVGASPSATDCPKHCHDIEAIDASKPSLCACNWRRADRFALDVSAAPR
jgi:type II secretion system protein H